MREVRGRLFLATLFVSALCTPIPARAQDSPPAAAQATPPSGALPSAAPPSGSSEKPAGLDFNLFGPEDAASATANSADRIASTGHLAQQRRHRLETHQLLGLTTWAFMAASCIVGQLNYNDLYGGGSGRGNFMMPHRLLVYSTAGLFTATGIYALLAPQPYKKPLKFDTGLIHRIAALGATAGMLTEVALGFITARTADSGNSSGIKEMAKAHAVVGWTTLGFMTAAGAVWLF
jgi:hypothetical protein